MLKHSGVQPFVMSQMTLVPDWYHSQVNDNTPSQVFVLHPETAFWPPRFCPLLNMWKEVKTERFYWKTVNRCVNIYEAAPLESRMKNIDMKIRHKKGLDSTNKKSIVT